MKDAIEVVRFAWFLLWTLIRLLIIDQILLLLALAAYVLLAPIVWTVDKYIEFRSR